MIRGDVVDDVYAVFLSNNNISVNDIMRALHKDVREYIFEKIYLGMKSDKKKMHRIIRIYQQNRDNCDAVRKIISIFFKNYEMSQEDITWIDGCLRAALRKKETRKSISKEIRTGIWNKQNKRCALCGKPLNLSNAQLDHIIPWDFVGDELNDNYQILCARCNKQKNNRIATNIKQIISRMINEY